MKAENKEPMTGATESEGFSPETYQPVPSILLNELSQQKANGKPVLETRDIAVYALLKAYARQKADCFPSYQRLAEKACCHPSTIQRSLKRLAAANHVQLKNRSCTGKIFILTDMEGGKVVRRMPRPVAPMLRAPMPHRVSCQKEAPVIEAQEEIFAPKTAPKAATGYASVNMLFGEAETKPKEILAPKAAEKSVSEDELADMEAAYQEALAAEAAAKEEAECSYYTIEQDESDDIL